MDGADQQAASLVAPERPQPHRDLPDGVVVVRQARDGERVVDLAVEQVRDLRDERRGLAAAGPGDDDGVIVVQDRLRVAAR